MSALLTLPNRDGCSEHTLPSKDPIPLEGVGPILQPDLHELRVPFDLIGPLEHFLLEFKGLEEPLGHLQVLDGCVASPACGDLLWVVLLFHQDSLVLQVLYGCLTSFQYRHTGVLAGELGHLTCFIDSLLQFEVVLHDPFQIVLVTDGTDHHVPCSVLHLDLGVGDDLDVSSEQRCDQLLSDQMLLLLVVRVYGNGLACA